MAEIKGVFFVLSLLAVFGHQVTGDCMDSISRKNPLTLRDKDNPEKDLAVLKSCKQLAKSFPDLCEKTKKNPGSTGTIIGGDGGMCCKSCGDPSCLDKITKTTKFTIGNFAFTSCKSLVKRFPGVCIDEGQAGKNGMPGGACCQACKGVSTDCVDLPQLITFNDEEKGTCAKIVKKDKCRCDITDVKDACCATCAKVDTAKCKCRDLLGKDRHYGITVKDEEGNTIMAKNITSCKEVVQFYADDCARIGGEGQVCCKSCQGVDTSCSDNIAWTATIGGCVDCSCHDIRRKNKMLMRKACKNDIKGSNSDQTARGACCLQCKLLGF